MSLEYGDIMNEKKIEWLKLLPSVIIILGMFSGLVVWIASLKELPKRVDIVEKDVSGLKTNISALQSDVKNINENTKQILDHLLNRKNGRKK